MGLIPSRNPWQRRTIQLGSDLMCVHCQYNLRGLPISGSCPECGGSVWDSFLRKDLPLLRTALRSASSMCWMLAVMPLLMLALMVVPHELQSTEAASIPLLLTWLWCLFWGSCGWRFLPLTAFQPAARLTAATFTLALLTALAGGVGIAATLASEPRLSQIAWEGAILFACGVYCFTLGTPARAIYTLGDATLCRVLQILQMASLFPAAATMASLLLELTAMAGVPRSPAMTLASIYALASSAALVTVAVRLHRYSAV